MKNSDLIIELQKLHPNATVYQSDGSPVNVDEVIDGSVRLLMTSSVKDHSFMLKVYGIITILTLLFTIYCMVTVPTLSGYAAFTIVWLLICVGLMAIRTFMTWIAYKKVK